MKIFCFLSLLFFSNQLFAEQIDFSKCRVFGSVIYTELECSENCKNKICSMKAECNLGIGPFQVELICQALGEKICPDIQKCSNDKNVSFAEAHNQVRPQDHQSNGNMDTTNSLTK